MTTMRTPARHRSGRSMRRADPEGGNAVVFAYKTAARRLGVSAAAVRTLEAEARREFPDDPMLRVLHLLRAVKAAASGKKE